MNWFQRHNDDAAAVAIVLGFILFVVIALTACGGASAGDDDDSWCQQQYNVTTEIVTDSGVNIHPGEGMYISPNDIEIAYQQVSACVGVDADGPNVFFLSFSEMGNDAYAGLYDFAGNVYINTDDPIGRRDCAMDTRSFKHETVHYLMDVGGYDFGDNYGHNSTLFGDCT